VTGWLLDTNVLSELRRPKLERTVLGVRCGTADTGDYVNAPVAVFNPWVDPKPESS